jgi:hypothetical protein
MDPKNDILIYRRDAMNKDAIVAEIKKLSPEDRREVFDAVNQPAEGDYELTSEDIAVVEARLKYAKEHPETVMGEEQFWSTVDSLTAR